MNSAILVFMTVSDGTKTIATSTIISQSSSNYDNGWKYSSYFTFTENPQIELYKTYTASLYETDSYSYSSVKNGITIASGTLEYVTPEQIRLTWGYPFDSTSINTDFTHFQVKVNNPETGITQGASLEVLLDDNPQFTSPIVSTDWQTHILQPNTTTTIDIQKSQAITQNGLYYAKVRNIGTNSSSTISFNMGNIDRTTWTGQTWPYTSSTLQSTSTEVNPFYVDCTDESFLSACSLKKAAYAIIGFLVVPPDFINNYMKDSLSNLNTVFPFSILYSFTGAINGEVLSTPTLNYNNTSSTMPNGVSVNILSANAFRDVLTTTDCNSSCAQTKVDYLFDIIENIIWFMTAIAVIILII
jgi:hypothetical protein